MTDPNETATTEMQQLNPEAEATKAEAKTIEYTTGLTPPSFETQEVYDLTDPEQPREWLERNKTKASKERDKALAQASVRMLYSTDVSKLDDAGVKGLYQSVTEGVFGIPDTEGAFFGTRGSKDDFRRNVDLLRQFFKGNYKLAQDPEAEEFRKKSWEEKFKYALEHETAGNAISSDMGGERGTTLAEKIFSLAWMEVAAGDPDRAKEHEARAGDIARRGNYETMTPEEKHAYEADVIGEGFAPGVRPTARPTRTLRESRPSPRRSLQDVTSHSPRQNQTQQAKPPRRRAIPT